MEIECILPLRNELGEGPLWDWREQALYWVDIAGAIFHRYDPAQNRHEQFDVGVRVTALGLRQGGGFVMATADGLALWHPASATVTRLGNPEAGKPDARFNDGAVDPGGRFWAGTMAPGATSALYRLDADGSIHTMETGVTTANGLGWSPDGKTMYFTDSRHHVIYAYDYDPQTGSIANRRPFVSSPDEPGLPDGLAVDAEGCVWSARWDGWKVTRYDPQGRPMFHLQMPVQCPTSCAFGGPNLDELYVTSARVKLRQEQRAAQPLAGGLFRLRPGVRGQKAYLFRG